MNSNLILSVKYTLKLNFVVSFLMILGLFFNYQLTLMILGALFFLGWICIFLVTILNTFSSQ